VREGFIKKSPPTPLYERGELKKLGRNYRLCLLCSSSLFRFVFPSPSFLPYYLVTCISPPLFKGRAGEGLQGRDFISPLCPPLDKRGKIIDEKGGFYLPCF
jgi:hypothetical protein